MRNTRIDTRLVGQTAENVDHTTRNQITLGGNCVGNLPFREALLPLLVAEASVEIVGPSGRRTLRLDQTYHKQLRLEPGELLVSFSVNRKLASAPFYHRRREVHSKIDYPLVTACFLVDPDSGSIRMAVSGAFFYPVRSVMVERVLNDRTMTIRLRAKRVIDAFQVTLREDFRGSSSYRRMLLERIIVDALSELEKEHVGV
jgi:CO/xanthine dehydrogenase FAD-binding subunit